jgi:hypothetical protein
MFFLKVLCVGCFCESDSLDMGLEGKGLRDREGRKVLEVFGEVMVEKLLEVTVHGQ